MSHFPCPDRATLWRLLEGEVSENRGAALRAHAKECRHCALAIDAYRQLTTDLSAPTAAPPSPLAVEQFMRRLDLEDTVGRPVRRSRGAWRVGVGGLVFATAAALSLVLFRTPPPAPAELTPRGNAAAWADAIALDLWALENPPRKLAAESLVEPTTAFFASYRSPGVGFAHLLLFAIDANAEVHWLYPGWLDAGTNPEAIRLAPSSEERPLAEAVVLEGVRPGPLRLVAILAPTPMRVSNIESLPPSERSLAALRQRWPAARIDEVPLIVSAPEHRP